MPTMREHALRNYPESVDADPRLISPTQLMQNLADWRSTRTARRASVDAFPESMITGGPSAPRELGP